jgi:hypothetical protein
MLKKPSPRASLFYSLIWHDWAKPFRQDKHADVKATTTFDVSDQLGPQMLLHQGLVHLLVQFSRDATAVHAFSRRLNHVPIIDPNPRRGVLIPLDPAQRAGGLTLKPVDPLSRGGELGAPCVGQGRERNGVYSQGQKRGQIAQKTARSEGLNKID